METGLPTPNKIETNGRRFDFPMISNESKEDLFEGVDSKWEKRMSTVCVCQYRKSPRNVSNRNRCYFVFSRQRLQDIVVAAMQRPLTMWFICATPWRYVSSLDRVILCLKPVALVPITAQSHDCHWLMECESMSISENEKKPCVSSLLPAIGHIDILAFLANENRCQKCAGLNFWPGIRRIQFSRRLSVFRLWLLCYYRLYWFLLQFGISIHIVFDLLLLRIVFTSIYVCKRSATMRRHCQSIFINFICSFFSYKCCSLCDLHCVQRDRVTTKERNVSRKQKHTESMKRTTEREREKIRSGRCLCVLCIRPQTEWKQHERFIFVRDNLSAQWHCERWQILYAFVVSRLDAFLLLQMYQSTANEHTHTLSRMLDALSFCYLRFNKFILIFWLFRKRRTVSTQFSWMWNLSSVFFSSSSSRCCTMHTCSRINI